MEMGVFQCLDTDWDHEPDRPKGVTKPSRGQRPDPSTQLGERSVNPEGIP